MSMFHYSTKEKRAPGYGGVAAYANGGPTGQMMSSAPVDAAVTDLFRTAVTSAQVDVALRALDAYEAERAEARRQRQMQVQRADYEVDLTRLRYEAADPANRLVPAELESQWEQALRDRERLAREAEEVDRQAASPPGAAERRKVRAMAAGPLVPRAPVDELLEDLLGVPAGEPVGQGDPAGQGLDALAAAVQEEALEVDAGPGGRLGLGEVVGKEAGIGAGAVEDRRVEVRGIGLHTRLEAESHPLFRPLRRSVGRDVPTS